MAVGRISGRGVHSRFGKILHVHHNRSLQSDLKSFLRVAILAMPQISSLITSQRTGTNVSN